MSNGRVTLVVALGALAAGCLQVRPDDPVVGRIDGIEQRVAAIERVASNESLLEIAEQLQIAQDELRTLRGELERIDHDVDGQKKRARDLYVDLDQRLKAVEQGVQQAAAGAAGPADAGAGDTAYQAAFELMKQARYEQARAAFTEFLVQYPKSELADNAQYWIGESWYVTKGYQQAVAEFKKLINGHAESDKLQDAYLKLGYCHYELKQDDEARKALTAVTQRFPDTNTAKLALQRLKKMTDEGR